MFQHIKDILSQISPGQRLLALVFLLFSISLIIVGPKIVDSLTNTDEELIVITNRQRDQIIQLNTELSELNLQMIKNKTECTNLVVEREKEILKMIEDLQKGLSIKSNQRVYEPTGGGPKRDDYYINNGDTIRIAGLPANEPVKQVEDVRVPMMMDGLNKIKGKIKTNIKNQQ